MKRKSEIDSKAGTNSKRNGKTLKDLISKSASIMLVAIMSMSFVQDSSFVTSIDTNLNATNERNIETVKAGESTCCATAVINPGDKVINANYISIPNKKAVYNADREAIVKFISEVKSKRIWSLDLQPAQREADKEMNFNFKVSNMFPSSIDAQKADSRMFRNFYDDIILQSSAFIGNYVSRADTEIANNFITANLSIPYVKADEELIAVADREISRLFESANNISISFPTVTAILKADQEIMQNHQMQKLLSGLNR